MSVVGLTLEVSVAGESGAPAVERMAVAFERFGAELSDFGRRVFPALIPVFEEEAKRRFSERGPGWAPLSVRYAAWKAKHFPGAPLMRRSGDLEAALTTSNSPHSLRDYSATQFNYGTTGLEYPSFHQFGTRHMPVRQLMGFSEGMEAKVVRAGAQALREAGRDSGVDRFVDWQDR